MLFMTETRHGLSGPAIKKGRGEEVGAGGVRLENHVERISPSESKCKLSCSMYLKNIMHLAC